MSYADTQTDKLLAKLERKIKKEYGRAYDEMTDTYYKYIDGWDEVVNGKVVHHKGLQERYDEEYEAYKAGKYTDQEFKDWYRTQIERGERYNHMRQQMAERMAEANKVASAYVNDTTPGIYALNANYTAYQIENASGVAFDIVNEQTVRRLMEGDNHTEFRVLRTNRERDYNWNYEQIQSALTAGILQGKSITDLTDAFLTVMGRNRNAAIRNARTACTSAQNGGRQDTFNRAIDMGIKLKKRWVSAHDDRTRLSHQMLDGETVENDKEFSNGLMYPGDPSGAPGEVYNCRCAMKAILPGINDAPAEKYEGWVKQKTSDIQKNVDVINENVDIINENVNINKTDYVDIKQDTLSEPKEENIREKRAQIETGYKGKISDDDIEEYNKKAFEQIKKDTKYNDEEARIFHKTLLEYFGGDFENVLNDTEKTQIIKNGLEKMPAYDGKIYRGMIFDNIDIEEFTKKQPGDIIETKSSISSWTSNERASLSFGGANSYERSTVVLECDNNINAVGVQHISKFGDREAEVLSYSNYEITEIVIENKYDYLSKHKELLYFPEDLEEEAEEIRKNVVCLIKVKEKI